MSDSNKNFLMHKIFIFYFYTFNKWWLWRKIEIEAAKIIHNV